MAGMEYMEQSQICGFHMLDVFDTIPLFPSRHYNEPVLLHLLPPASTSLAVIKVKLANQAYMSENKT